MIDRVTVRERVRKTGGTHSTNSNRATFAEGVCDNLVSGQPLAYRHRATETIAREMCGRNGDHLLLGFSQRAIFAPGADLHYFVVSFRSATHKSPQIVSWLAIVMARKPAENGVIP